MAKTKDSAIDYQKKNYYDGNWSPDYEKFLIPTFGQISGPDWKLVAWNNALTYGPIFSEDIVARLGELEIPVTLILGTRDRTAPGRDWKKENIKYELGQYQNFGKKMKKVLPSIKVIELDGLGHMPQFEDYERFSRKFFPLF